jgi:hypothetical protein
LSLISIYRSLGGGWEMRLSRGGALPCKVKVPLSAPLPCGEKDDYCAKPYPDICKNPCTNHEACGPVDTAAPPPPAPVQAADESGTVKPGPAGIVSRFVETMKAKE